MSKENNENKNSSLKNNVNSSDKVKIHKEPLFNIWDIVKHKIYPFRGVIIDVDPEFSITEECYQSIPAENSPLEHPELEEIFSGMDKGKYHLRNEVRN